MIIYNVTVKVDWKIEEQWIQWMKETHIPAVMATGCFTRYQLVRLLDIDEIEGPTYAAQYYAETRDKLDEYIHQFAPALRKDGLDRWGDQFIAFRTLMEVVQ